MTELNRFEQRIENLRKLFPENGIEGLFIRDVYNVSYFTGKKGDDCCLYISEKEARAMLNGKKKKSMNNRIKAVKPRANDKIYYCERVEKEFGPVEQVQNKLMKKTQKEKEKAEKKTKDK